MTSGASRGPSRDAARLQAAVVRFLSSCQQPAIIDPGQPLLAVQPDRHSIEIRAAGLVIQAWDESRNLVRRVTGIVSEKRGRMELEVARFGGKPGKLILTDLSAAAGQRGQKDARRFDFREQFRRFLRREFPGWRTEVSAEIDLEHSFSGTCSRAFLRKGQAGLAAVGAPPEASGSGHALAAGLLWLDYLRRREVRKAVDRLVIYLPQGEERLTRQRVRWLDPGKACCEVFVYGQDECAAQVDLRDSGNLDTAIDAIAPLPQAVCEMVEALAGTGGVEAVRAGDGEISLRVRGLEFARSRGGELWLGLGERRKLRNVADARRLAAEIERVRRPDADRLHPLYTAAPELWLESRVRAGVRALDATLEPSPLYGQVAAWAGGQRGVIDLLAVDHAGRLAVIELKATEDLYLPLQALDYWMRVKWHLERGELAARGYFAGIALSAQAPRLLLVSPALHFHPTTQTLVRFLSPDVEVEVVGLSAGWRTRVDVAFRRRRRSV